MNTRTLVVTILTLWLVMGLGFLSSWTRAHKAGRRSGAILTSKEGLLFIASVLGSIIYFICAA